MNPDRELIEEALPGYEIGEELGRGAWGVVLSGRHRRLGRLVAIKQLPRAFAADPNVSARFLSEARMAASLEHPHIVPVYDYVEMDGLALIVMEQCPTTVAARFQAEGLGIDEACASALATCSALAYAHERQVLHRDIKPENLLIDQDGVVKLGDFGIARALDAATRLTATGTVMGTPAYMSPEQAGGEDLGPHSDVYSTGVVLYELLSGDFPFEEASSVGALLRQHLFEPPRPLDDVAPDVPEPIASVVDRALEKDPGDRWPSAVALGVALGEATAAAFGAAWPRRRGFALFGSPEIVAATERGGAGTTDDGTVAVSGAQRASSSAPVVPESSPAPSDQVDMSRATTAPIAGPVVTPSRSRRGLPIVIAAAALVLIVVVAGYLALSGGDDGSDSLASGDSSSVGGDGGSAVAPVGTSAGQLVIGTLIDSSGSQDGDQEAAVMLAVEEINEAGGVLGQPLAILSGRYDGEAALVLQADEHMRGGAVALVGPSDPSHTTGVVDTVVGDGVILISAADPVGHGDDSGLYFSTRSPAPLILVGALDLLPTGTSRVAIVTDSTASLTAASQSSLSTLLTERGIDATRVDLTDGGPVQAAGVVAGLDPEAVVILGTEELAGLYRALIDAGAGPATRPFVVVGVDGSAAGFGDGEIEGVIGITRDLSTGAALEERLGGVDVSADAAQSYDAQSYDAVVILSLAAEAAGSVEPGDIAALIPSVTAGGQACTTFAACRDLIASGGDVDYTGPGGTYEISAETGRPTVGSYLESIIGPDGSVIGDPERLVVRAGEG